MSYDPMTVNELIDQLQRLAREGHGNDPVRIVHTTSHHTPKDAAEPVFEVTVGTIQWNPYLDGFEVPDPEYLDSEQEQERAVIIR